MRSKRFYSINLAVAKSSSFVNGQVGLSRTDRDKLLNHSEPVCSGFEQADSLLSTSWPHNPASTHLTPSNWATQKPGDQGLNVVTAGHFEINTQPEAERCSLNLGLRSGFSQLFSTGGLYAARSNHRTHRRGYSI